MRILDRRPENVRSLLDLDERGTVGRSTLTAQLEPAARDTHPATLGAGKPGGDTGRGGPETGDVLPIDALDPVRGSLGGPQMLIVDNPETFRTPGVLGSTIAPVRDRGDTVHDFVGTARYFGLSQNGTGKPLRNMLLIKNTSAHDVTFTIAGEVLCNKGVTPTDGRIQPGYQRDGVFQGPQAIAASAYLDARPGKNGYVQKTITVKAGDTEVVNDQYHAPGSEVFALVAITADIATATFRVGCVAHATSLTEAEETAVATGDWDAAGSVDSGKDFAPADAEKLGRPNGVIGAGSVFTGMRVFDVTAGSRAGDLVMATKLKNAGSSEAATLDKPLPNKPGTGDAATANEGNYGIEYLLRYVLRNADPTAPVVARLLFTAPRVRPAEVFRPDGGMITIPLDVDGSRIEVRVNEVGAGVEVGHWTLPPGGERSVAIRFVNFGNIFPPAGFEVRGA